MQQYEKYPKENMGPLLPLLLSLPPLSLPRLPPRAAATLLLLTATPRRGNNKFWNVVAFEFHTPFSTPGIVYLLVEISFSIRLCCVFLLRNSDCVKARLGYTCISLPRVWHGRVEGGCNITSHPGLRKGRVMI